VPATAAAVKTIKTSNVVSGATFRTHQRRVLARRDALVAEHLDLVRAIALSIHASLPRSFELDDLIGAGNIGLIKAATRYRPRLHSNTPFRLFAWRVIRGAILDTINKRHYVENTRPSIDECAEPAVENVIEISIDRKRRLARVSDAMLYLTPQKQAVVRNYYGSPDARFEDVAKQVGLGRTKTQRLHHEAIEELQSILHVR
jgi:RNA polymerase sigma factor (sigma-70 family)